MSPNHESTLVVYCGTFDPWHRGHQFQLENAIKSAAAVIGTAELNFLVVVNDPGHKRPTLSLARRQAIIRPQVAALPPAKVDLAGFVGLSIYDIHQHFQNLYPETALWFLGTSDVLRDAKPLPRDLPSEATMNWLVSNRDGLPDLAPGELEALGYRNYRLMPYRSLAVSSSAIKTLTQASSPQAALLCDPFALQQLYLASA